MKRKKERLVVARIRLIKGLSHKNSLQNRLSIPPENEILKLRKSKPRLTVNTASFTNPATAEKVIHVHTCM